MLLVLTGQYQLCDRKSIQPEKPVPVIPLDAFLETRQNLELLWKRRLVTKPEFKLNTFRSFI